MPRDGDVVVIHQDLDVQLLRHGQARRFGVIAFHLAAIRPQHHHGLARVRHRDPIAEGPHVSEAPGTELHPRRHSLLRMAGQPGVELAIVQQAFSGHVPVEYGQQVLSRHPMAGLVIDHRHDGCATGDEGAHDHEFRHRVVGTAGVARQAPRAGQGGEEHDGVASQLNVLAQGRALFVGKGRDSWIELQGH